MISLTSLSSRLWAQILGSTKPAEKQSASQVQPLFQGVAKAEPDQFKVQFGLSANEINKKELQKLYRQPENQYMLARFVQLARRVTPTANPKKLSPENNIIAGRKLTAIQNLIAREFKSLGITDENIIKASGSLIVKIPAAQGYEDVQPLILMGHLDIVPASSETPFTKIIPTVFKNPEDGKTYITSDGTTTLGSDNKASVAIMLDAIRRLMGQHPQQKMPLPHGPIELVLTLDEEIGCPSYRNLPTEKLLNGKDVICVDADRPGEAFTSMAGSNTIQLSVKNPGQLNRNLILAKLLKQLEENHKQGCMIEADEQGNPLLSKNATLTVKNTPLDPQKHPNRIKIDISGLKEGHSGLDAQFISANSIVANIITALAEGDEHSHFQKPYVKLGSHAPNALCTKAVVAYEMGDTTEALNKVKTTAQHLEGEYQRKIQAIYWLRNISDPVNLKISVVSEPNNAPFFANKEDEKLFAVEGETPSILLKLRSNSEELEARELAHIRETFKKFNTDINKVDPSANIEKAIDRLDYKPWVAQIESPLYDAVRSTGKTIFNKEIPLLPVHAGAQPAMLHGKTNIKGESLTENGVLIGPWIDGMHSRQERVQVESLAPSRDWLVAMIQAYAEHYKKQPQ